VPQKYLALYSKLPGLLSKLEDVEDVDEFVLFSIDAKA
jgi:hypothetical protein